MNNMLLIDGDILVYQAVSAAQQELELDDNEFQYHCNLNEAEKSFISGLQAMITGFDKFVICLSDPRVNWRKAIYPEYKSNRKNVRKPLGHTKFRSWVENSYPCVTKPTLEADDILGILATKPGNDAVIWSIDKDLRQIPGKHLRDDGMIYEVTEVEGDYFHLRQTLTGDPTDGYPGCPGVGPVTADKLLGDLDLGPVVSEKWPVIEAAYEKAGSNKAAALVQARIARICRYDDWDGAKQQVKLWSPNV